MLKQFATKLGKINPFNITPAAPVTAVMLDSAWKYYHNSNYSESYNLFNQILTIAPDHPRALHGFGLCLWMTGDLNKAEKYLDKVLHIHHDRPYIYLSLSKLSIIINNLDKAKNLLQKLLILSPDHPYAIHTLSALNKQLPPKPPEKYIANYFKTYNNIFEKHMATLDYKTPEILVKLLDIINLDIKTILDLGCGTGLLGKEIKNIFPNCSLSGIDLSENMMQQAKNKKIYNYLSLQDMYDYLQKTNNKFDLICAADSLVYLGDLSQLFKLCYQKLTPHGLLLFSVEDTDKHQSYYLQLNGRYAHSSDYISSLVTNIGFTLLKQNLCPCRKEYGEPVIGNHSLYRK